MLKQISVNLRKLSPVVVQNNILETIRKNSKRVLDMNKEQLLQGEDSKGEMLMPYRSVAYADMKLTYNSLGVTDLKLEGSFHNGFFLNADNFPFYIFSRDEKTRKLVGKYGIDIFGLDENNLHTLAEDIVLPSVKVDIVKAIHI